MRSRNNPSLGLVALACASGCLLLSHPAPARAPLQVLHKHVRPAVTSGEAALIGPLPTERRLDLSILLTLRDQPGLTRLLGRLYDPTSSDYRKFLSVSEFTDQFTVTAPDHKKVVDFLRANGLTVTGTPANRLLVQVNGSVAQINKAFDVTMNVYQHPTESRTFYSPDREPSLDLDVPVSHIEGLNDFSIPRHVGTSPSSGNIPGGDSGHPPPSHSTGSGPGDQFLASDMRAAYYGGSALTGRGQVVGVFEWAGYLPTDVALTFSSADQGSSVPIENVLATPGASPAQAPGHGDGEQVLDIVQPMGMAPGLDKVRVYIGGTSDIFNAMASENVAKQLTCSYSWGPDDPQTLDPIFQELAAQGQALFIASADGGAYVPGDLSYPADDVFVTGVGGTDLSTHGHGGAWESETAWSHSGGGPSPAGIPIPSWQSGVATWQNGGSVTLRNVPDISMNGDFDNYSCSQGKCGSGGGGTSFSAPRWAGFMALINQQAVAAGTAPRGSIGFLNPGLYAIGKSSSYTQDLHDITSGGNGCCGQPIGAYYPSVKGYDLTTGWGSPTGQALIDALAGPARSGFTLTHSHGQLKVKSSQSVTTIITVHDLGGFTGNVNLAVSDLPHGVTATFDTNPTSATSTLTLTADGSPDSGIHHVTIKGTSGPLSATARVALTVNPAPSFVLAISPESSITLTQGTTVSAKVLLTDLEGFAGPVTLAASNLPSGVTASFSPNPIAGSTTTEPRTTALTLKASRSATVASVPSVVTITGTSGALGAITYVALTVVPPGFTLSPSPKAVLIDQGATGTAKIKVDDLGTFHDSVNLSVSNLPSGVTASFSPGSTSSSSVLTLTAGSAVAPGRYSLHLKGVAGSHNAKTDLSLIVFSPLTLSASPSSLAVKPADSATTVVTLAQQSGFTGLAKLSVSGLPDGVTASFHDNPTTLASMLEFKTSDHVTPGQYRLTLTAVSGTQTATTKMSLNVAAARVISGSLGGDTGPFLVCTTYDACGDIVSYSPLTLDDYNQPVGIVSSQNAGKSGCLVGSALPPSQTICVPETLKTGGGLESGGLKRP